ncbi:putative UDP-N-acetylglucosamine pyrophosphorylase [Dirofilaria immitis]|nr:putative UDP-N-acetylglucosamine pyrophosphorylase [Dirofilaria immitis]
MPPKEAQNSLRIGKNGNSEDLASSDCSTKSLPLDNRDQVLLYLTTVLAVPKTMHEDRSRAMAMFGNHDYLLHFWDELTPEEREQLINQFTSYNISELDKAFKESGRPVARYWFLMCKSTFKMEGLRPIDKDHYSVAVDIDENIMNEYWRTGLEAISKRQVAAVVLAGGQATRLDSAEPKGTLSLGFTDCDVTDSLFALQAARISRLQDLARAAFPNSDPKIWW